jgi:hypothetical protein
MMATTTQETFAALARPQRQVHDRYIRTHTHTHTHRDRPASPCTTHGPLSAVTAKRMQIPCARHSLQLRAHSGMYMLILYIYIYIYTNTHTHIYIYIHTHTHTETGQQIHVARTASCLQVRRNDYNIYTREFR